MTIRSWFLLSKLFLFWIVAVSVDFTRASSEKLGEGSYGVVTVDPKHSKYVIKTMVDKDRKLIEPELNFHMHASELLAKGQNIPNILIAEAFFWERDVLNLRFPRAEKIAGPGMLSEEAEEMHFVTNKKKFLKDIASALTWLHEQNIAHCDIKLPNIMYYQQAYVLIDFGSVQSRVHVIDEIEKIHKTTSWYRSPELLLNNHSFPCEGDIWSTAISYLHLFYDTRLFKYDGELDKDLTFSKAIKFQQNIMLINLSLFLDQSLFKDTNLEEIKHLQASAYNPPRKKSALVKTREQIIAKTIDINLLSQFNNRKYIKDRLLQLFRDELMIEEDGFMSEEDELIIEGDEFMSEEEAELLSAMMMIPPNMRIMASSILHHEFLSE